MSADRAASRAKGLIPFVIAALVCLVLGGLAGVWASSLERGDAPEQVRFIPPREVPPNFRLRDQDGRWASTREARGKVLVLTFLYTSCRDLCPAQAAEIVGAVGKVGGGIEVYGVSVDPVGDTPARARAFLERFGLTGGPVRYLVGSRRELAPVWRQFGIVPIGATPGEARDAAVTHDRFFETERRGPSPAYSPPRGRSAPDAAREPFPAAGDLRYRGRARHRNGWDFEHSAYVMLLDKQGRQRVGLPFEQLGASVLAQDMRALLKE